MNTKTKAAFTLIELLVAILIVGILAAIAVSQYQKAVRKSRIIQAITPLKTITDAQELYYLSHGEYTNNIKELDISVETKTDNIPNKWNFSCKEKRLCQAVSSDPNLPNLEFELERAPSGSANWVKAIAGKHYCVAMNKSEQARNLCAKLGREDNTLAKFNYATKGQYFLLN